MILKKLNVGFLALVLGLGLVMTQSAFKSVEPLKTTQPELYWYYIDGGVFNGLAYPDKVDKDFVMNPSNNITDCEDLGSEFCLIGYETEQNTSLPPTSPSTADHRVLYPD